MLGLHPLDDTITSEGIEQGVEIDLVTHDAAKFFRLLLKKNGYVLEQLLSPLVVQTTPEHAELVAIAPKCLTRFHAFHYLGFAETQWKLFSKETPPRVKPLLYRVLLTGIHLMRAGVVRANLRHLNVEYRLPYIDDLIARRRAGPSKVSWMAPTCRSTRRSTRGCGPLRKSFIAHQACPRQVVHWPHSTTCSSDCMAST